MSTMLLKRAATQATNDPGVLPRSLSIGSPRCGDPDLTIHRRTSSHHGRALRTLGHAAEYLVNTRSTSSTRAEVEVDRQAVRILMRLSREVFEEYATLTMHNHPVTDWVMNRAVRIYGAA
jgi:hypothetical protein